VEHVGERLPLARALVQTRECGERICLVEGGSNGGQRGGLGGEACDLTDRVATVLCGGQPRLEAGGAGFDLLGGSRGVRPLGDDRCDRRRGRGPRRRGTNRAPE